ncbi:3-hydroxyisobutyrate dehydrogenase [Psychromicrobium lacuslunae]|uniref:3-hydroxyisobutyrate dehydrogenase n=2 Tax=Psychromicrobium lacuslunae TaxID=1618207 RepID=A0A0D4C2U8_9MICC|nr:3-hydroxyisobutyrate dehydrogenase [Psychromicrobium lacuslunae]
MQDTENPRKIAVLGTGIIGAPIARNLQKAGYQVSVWNRTIAKAEGLKADGITVHSDPAAAVEGADFVLTVLKDGNAVLEALQSAEAKLKAEAILVQISTVGLKEIARIQDWAAERKIALVDAPILGSKAPAENAQLVVLAAAEESLHDAVTPVFEAIAKKTLWVGDQPGGASALKVVVNSFIGALTHGVAEAAKLAAALNLPLQQLQEAISGGPLDSPFVSSKLGAIVNDDFGTTFSIDNALKDAGLVEEAAQQSGAWLPVAEASQERYRAASQSGLGSQDMIASYLAEQLSPASGI